jgi:TIR domain
MASERLPNPLHSGEGQDVDIFLCHNRADKEWVRRLAEQIESETFDGKPNGRPLRVFFDEWDIEAGGNIVIRINDGLKRARYVAVILSPEMLTADWPALEWTSVVADDPTNRRGRLIPLIVRDGTEEGSTRVELPAPLKVTNWIDFRTSVSFRQAFQKLIRRVRNMAPQRGRKRAPIAMLPSPAASIISEPDSAAAPDKVTDVVLGNLLPVESFPGTIWSGSTDVQHPKEVWAVVQDAPAFELKAGRLYTFADLSRADSPLKPSLSAKDIKGESVRSWARDPDKWRWFISLLNRCLKQHIVIPLNMGRDERGRFFFKPGPGLSRKHGNNIDREREVAAKKTNEATGDSFWVHHAAWLQFQTLGNELYLLVDPSYVFTSDGTTPLKGRIVGPLSMKWSGKERNAAILRHIVFWARTLARRKTKIEIDTGAAPIVVSGIPALARTTFGIEFDHIAIGSLINQVTDELGKVAASVDFGAAEEGEDEEEVPESF